MNLEQLNINLFYIFNASDHPSALIKQLALFSSNYLIAIIGVVLLALAFLKKEQRYWHAVSLSLCSIAVALITAKIFSLFYYHPRPFVLHIGHTLIHHAKTTSLPSHHMLGITALAFSFLVLGFRKIFFVLFISSLFIGWSRMYLGVHFPFDLISAEIWALISVYLMKNISTYPCDKLMARFSRNTTKSPL